MSSYVFPLKGKYTTERIDQGNDFGGTGSILAIGKAKIERVGDAPGWPGTGGILYKLLEGPSAGKFVYVYEGVKSAVSPGQIVKAGQAIGSLVPGSSTGIEMGWANGQGEPISHAEYTEGKETKGGKAFASFINALKGGGGGNPLEALTGAIGEATSPASSAASTVSNLPSEVASGLSNLFTEHAESFALNLVLLVGGAFMVYYGIALMFGVRKPGGAAVKAVTPA